MAVYSSHPVSCLSGRVTNLPGDKSITHRLLMLGAIAEGTTVAKQALISRDTLATATALKQLGAQISLHADQIVIQGVGLQGLCSSSSPLDAGNSATTLRLLTGLLAGSRIAALLTGDASLCRRPMRRIAHPLIQMGAGIELARGEYAPIQVKPTEPLKGISYSLPVASAQVKSAILLAGLYAQGSTIVIEDRVTRNHTELLLQALGATITVQKNAIQVSPASVLKGIEMTVPADFSSAAFFIVAACIAKQAEITLCRVGVNATRIGLLHILNLMGAEITLSNQRVEHGEPIADITVRSAALRGIEIPPAYVASAIDEFPVIFIAAAYAHGKTRVTGASELRYKESDRLAIMAAGLKRLGIEVVEHADGLTIQGGSLQGGKVNAHGDHRVAMAFAIAAVSAKAPITIEECANIVTSFPNFINVAHQLGLHITA